MTRPFAPEDYEVPLTLTRHGFRLEPVGPQHNDADHRAWWSSIEHIRATPGFPAGDGRPLAGCHSRRTSRTCEGTPRASRAGSASRTSLDARTTRPQGRARCGDEASTGPDRRGASRGRGRGVSGDPAGRIQAAATCPWPAARAPPPGRARRQPGGPCPTAARQCRSRHGRAWRDRTESGGPSPD